MDTAIDVTELIELRELLRLAPEFVEALEQFEREHGGPCDVQVEEAA